MFETVLTCPNYVLMSQSYPLALAAIFRDRDGDVATAFLDIEEDHYSVDRAGFLHRTDGQSYSIVWIEDKDEWVDWDDADVLRSYGVPDR